MTTLPKLLLVDDREENLVALEALLRAEDVEILTARSGREALELLLLHDFALALIDVQMPEMDGYELASLMRGTERSRGVPILFVTAGGRDAAHVGRAYSSGAVDFLPKPIDPFVLRCKIDVFLRLYRARQELASRIAAEEKTVEKLSELLRLNELFTAALGHDLRNPLSAILTGAELLARRAGDERTATGARRISSSARRMSRMIEQLLEFARARTGGISLVRGDVELGEICRRIAAEVQASAPERTIEVTCPAELHGEWDAVRLAQVVSNLVGNAVRHGEAIGAVRVTVSTPAPGVAAISVWNAGAIPEDEIPSLFEPFRAGARAARRGEGLGLGLYIVQQIAAAHGGDVTVTSSAAEGTTFRVLLPLVAGETSSSVPAARAPPVTS